LPRILIIRFSSIGDLVLTSPVIRCLKNQLPGASVHFVTKAAFLPAIEANPHIDKIHLLGNAGWFPLLSDLRAENFDMVIDLHKNLRSLIIKSFLLKPSRSFRKLNLEKWISVRFKITVLPKEHIVDRYLETIKPWAQNDGRGLDYFIPTAFDQWPEEFPENFRTRYAVIALGAGHFTKAPPADLLCQVIDHLTIPVVLLGGKMDREKGELVSRHAPEKTWNASALLNLHQSAFVIKNAAVVISGDTGLMHIAAAFEKKIVSLWGNTIPEFGMKPYLPDHSKVSAKIVEIKGLSCRPCSKLGYSRCPKKHFRCMQHDPAEIAKSAVE
jgi:ADP-heptose:LPS heptosyltransferase